MLLYILVVDHFMTHKTTGLSFASRISALRYWHLVQVRSALFFPSVEEKLKQKATTWTLFCSPGKHCFQNFGSHGMSDTYNF